MWTKLDFAIKKQFFSDDLWFKLGSFFQFFSVCKIYTFICELFQIGFWMSFLQSWLSLGIKKAMIDHNAQQLLLFWKFRIRWLFMDSLRYLPLLTEMVFRRTLPLGYFTLIFIHDLWSSCFSNVVFYWLLTFFVSSSRAVLIWLSFRFNGISSLTFSNSEPFQNRQKKFGKMKNGGSTF